MRILVVSDIHESETALWAALDEQPTARTVLFLGDGLRRVEQTAERFTEHTFYTVPGNCDFAAMQPKARLEIIGGKRIFFTHGHLYGVKSDPEPLWTAARERGADIVLFGHTHQPMQEYRDGLYILNPGSLGYGGTYGYIDLTPSGGIVTNVVSLRR